MILIIFIMMSKIIYGYNKEDYNEIERWCLEVIEEIGFDNIKIFI